MANAELNIVLKLLDQATSEIKKSLGEVSKEQKNVAKTSKEASDTMTGGFKEAGKELKALRQTMFAATAIIASITLATKEWANRNQETNRAFDLLEYNLRKFIGLVGSLFAPTIIALGDLFNRLMPIITNFFKVIQDGYTAFFKSISFGIQYIVAFSTAMTTGIGIVQAHRIALGTAGKAAEEMGEKFKASFENNLPVIDATTSRLKSLVATYAEMSQLINNTDMNRIMQTAQSATTLLQTLGNMQKTMWASIFDFINMGITKFTSGFTTALTGIIMGTKKAGEAFKEFGLSMISAIVEFIIQYGVQALIAATIGKMVSGLVITQANAIAAAWLPAAVLASVATLGSAGAAGAAGLSGAAMAGVGTFAAMKAISSGMAIGASGMGQGGGGGGGWAVGTPAVPYDMVTMVHKNETIIPETFADAIRKGQLTLGGPEGAGNNPINVNIYYPKMSKTEEVKELARALGFEISRELRYVRAN